MPEQQSGGFNPLFAAMLLFMSSKPDLEGRIANLTAMLEATQKTLNTLRMGMENFHNMMLQYSGAPEQPPGKLLPDTKPEVAPPSAEGNFPTITFPDPHKSGA